eukprot:CAMPEP_0201135012 /NCGR_PEP_ID=MMETSP0850-20130426/53365_1 /ASSEMBLY_ACC=CAM_ASM_000622 /TAXON_ID=183588 /ORGANISM="Pseudo-nitzschia fraudulenta, Strain WWA7" /LENGTH=113 /DNA_ID=CAMNT_0047406107 /DNA_START=24 /DNA_END=365 /DNA_ORIENTATION=+
MPYQTEESLPVIDGGIASQNTTKKHETGMFKLLLVCVAVTSFLAGHASSSAASASLVHSEFPSFPCIKSASAITKECGSDVGTCAFDAIMGGGDILACDPDCSAVRDAVSLCD